MASSREIERTAAAWLARRDRDDWAGADQQQLDRWLAEATAHQVAFVRLESAWRQADRLKALGAGIAAGQIPERGSWSAAPPGRARPHRHSAARPAWQRLLAVAASVAAAIVLALGWQHYTAMEHADYATAVGELREVPLADGSTATLSSASRIAVTYSQGQRHIALKQGEAYFTVAKNHARPFVVSVGARRVIAVGTRFDVLRVPAGLRVVVTEGVVKLEAPPRHGATHVLTSLLPAGSVARADATGTTVHADTVQQAETYLSWRDGFLSFHDTPLATAVAEFNRFNTRQIVIGDPAAGSIRVGGNFRWSNTDAFVRLLTRGLPVTAQRQGEAIVLHHR